MSKKIYCLLTLMLMLSVLPAMSAGHSAPCRFVVMSDTHLLAPELFTPGKAIEQADAGESKMMAMSDDIVGTLMDSIIALRPSVVLLTGDLTHNGERASHERMAWHLNRLKTYGIQPLVIPGNHDCNNPFASQFDSDSTRPVATVTRKEFAAIYRDCGYSDTSQRDTASLSYCCEPVKDVVVIGIDSNTDELNRLASRGDSANVYHNGGRIKPQTLQWVVERAVWATTHGKSVIAMMHHHLMPHFDQEERLLPNYIIQDHDQVAQQLMAAGVHVIFTGHLHVTDAVTGRDAAGIASLVEVSTGSAISYPFAMHVATLDGKGKTLKVDTHWLTATSGCPTLVEQGRQRLINAAPVVASLLAGKAWDRLDKHLGSLKTLIELGGGESHLPQTSRQAAQLAMRHLGDALASAMLAVAEGNEQEKDTDAIIEQGMQGIRAMIAEVAPQQADSLWDFFLTNVCPRLDPMLRSLLEDRNGVGTAHETRTNDLSLTIAL